MTLVALGSTAPCALAQTADANPPLPQAPGKASTTNRPTVSPATGASQKALARPAWHELSPTQQQSLKPLAGKWASLSEEQKRKWLAISKNYLSLPPVEQAKLHSRMTEWVSLSQQQRAQARLNFAETKKLPPAEKAASWQAYQALSPEEKQKLAAKAPSKPAGAATVKPVSPQKIAIVPPPRKNPLLDSKPADGTNSLNRRTLLPQPNPLTEPAQMPQQ